MSDESSPGWDAITAACKRVHGEVEPRHFAASIPWALGGPDPLDGISVFPAEGHWHFVGYGLTELHSKESRDATTSGFGFELTFRVARTPDEAEPPAWAMNLMMNLARYVATSGNVFDVGHHISANGPIALGCATELVAVAFDLDPELGEIDTAHGHVKFLQMVGITLDELDAMRRWNAVSVLELIAKETRDDLLVTNLERRSILSRPGAREAVENGVAKDGSSMGETNVERLAWRQSRRGFEVVVGALEVPSIRFGIEGRVGHGHPFLLIGRDTAVVFEPAKESSANERDGGLVIQMSDDLAKEIVAKLDRKRGRYAFDSFADLAIEVIPSEIKDTKGDVVEVVG